MNREQAQAGNLTGSILIAHPSLLDPNFHQSLVFLSHHSADDGAIGLILNRPVRVPLGDFRFPLALPETLRSVPVFDGGPVASDELLLASIEWRENPSAVAFRGFGALAPDTVIPPECLPGLRAFRGYAGWSRGQLEAEIAERAWIVAQPERRLIEIEDPSRVWSAFLRSLDPVFRLIADAPDDPSRN